MFTNEAAKSRDCAFIIISGANSKELDSSSSHASHYAASIQADPSRPYQCQSCPAQFPEMFQLKTHVSNNHGETMPYTCPLCGKGYLSLQGYNLHMKKHEGKTFQCPICDSKFTQKSTLLRHMRSVHNSSQCPYCLRPFLLQEFEAHVQMCRNLFSSYSEEKN